MSITTQITRLDNNIDNIRKIKQETKEVMNNDFNIITDEQIEDYAELIENGLELYKDYIPSVKTEQATSITINDAMKYSKNKIEIYGNTKQMISILPNTYTQVDYLESHGEEYIDTGINADSNLRTVLDMAFTSPTDSNQNVGAINMNNGQIRYHILPQAGYFRIYVQTNSKAFNTLPIDTDRHFYDIDVPNQIVTIDNNNYNLNTTNFNVELNFYLFARNSTSTIYYSKTKLHRAKMYISGVLVRDFIPCYRNLDNEIGLYDIVNNVFYTNQGTGVFTYGSVITLPNPEYPIPVETVTGNNNIKCFRMNLFDCSATFVSSKSGLTNTIDDEDYIITNGKATANWIYICKPQDITDFLEEGETYTLWAEKYRQSDEVTYPRTYIQIRRTKIDGTQNTVFSSTNKIAFTVDKNIYSKYEINIQTGNEKYNYDNYKNRFMLLKGDYTNKEVIYEQYAEKNYPVNLGSLELCKIGDYQDYLYKENSNWYKQSVVKKVNLGDLSWTLYNNTVFYTDDSNISFDEDYLPYCKYFISSRESDIFNKIYYNVSNNHLNIEPSESFISQYNTAQLFKQWLLDNNVIAYIPQTSTSVQITDENLIAQLDTIYEHLELTKGINYITITANDLKPYMKLSYKNLDNNE